MAKKTKKPTRIHGLTKKQFEAFSRLVLQTRVAEDEE